MSRLAKPPTTILFMSAAITMAGPAIAQDGHGLRTSGPDDAPDYLEASGPLTPLWRMALPIDDLPIVGTTQPFPPLAGGRVLFVDDDARPGGDGRSWRTAFDDLQIALDAAHLPDATIEAIFVAQGVYVPTARTDLADPRTATFQLRNGLGLYGGFAGLTGPHPYQWDVDRFLTILSGDLAGDDLPDFVNYNENAYHVVRATDTDATAVLRGFIVEGGNANGTAYYYDGAGGGLFAVDAAPTLNQCRFRDNRAGIGGGAYLGLIHDTVAPLWSINQCHFEGNRAWNGGGIYSSVYESWARVRISNCTFRANEAAFWGGGAWASSGLDLLDCRIQENHAVCGGGVGNYSRGHSSFVRCDFLANSAEEEGGGLHSEYDGDPTIDACRFLGNSAIRGGGLFYHSEWNSAQRRVSNCVFSGNNAVSGGGVYAEYGGPILTNCVLFGNSAEQGGGLYVARAPLYSGQTRLINTIVWNNRAQSGLGEQKQIWFEHWSPLFADRSCIQDWSGFLDDPVEMYGAYGTGNIYSDPMFVDPDGRDNQIGTLDDNFRLLPGSPCVDAGDNDAEGLPASDLTGGDRIRNCRVDMGPYESPFFSDCDTSGLPDACEIIDGTLIDSDSDGVPDTCQQPERVIVERQQLVGNPPRHISQFGSAVALSGAWAAVGAPNDDDGTGQRGSVNLFEFDGGRWILRQTVYPPQPIGQRSFGNTVAMAGSWLVVRLDVGDEVFVLKREDGVWTHRQVLAPPDRAVWYDSAVSLAISEVRIVVGKANDNTLGTGTGAAYVFALDGQSWQYEATLLKKGGAAGHAFGRAVAIDRDQIVVGVPGDIVDGKKTGSVSVFSHDGVGWTELDPVLSPDRAQGDRFGDAVAVHKDYLAVGMPFRLGLRGAVVVFRRIGDAWHPVQKLWHPDRFLYFGTCVNMSGRHLLVTEFKYAGGNYGPLPRGFLYQLERDRWEEFADLEASDGFYPDQFGISAAMDGRNILIGAPFQRVDGIYPGKAYHFAIPNTGAGD